MSLSLRSRFWRAVLRKTLKEQSLSVAGYRVQGEKSAQWLGKVPKDVRVESINLDGLPADWLIPADADPKKVILYLHGGGYVTGSIQSYRMMCAMLAKAAGAKVLLPRYRLAPEQPFPAALEDALTAYRWLLAQGCNVIVAGDSAGGGLSLVTTLALRDANDPLPAAVICLSPWADLTLKGQTHVTQAKAEAVLKTSVLKEWALCYTAEANLINPLVSPVYADFHGFPPLFIQVGSDEILLDDSRLLAEKASAAGVDVTLKIWAGMWHVWQMLGDFIPENKKAFEEIGQFVRGQLSSPK